MKKFLFILVGLAFTMPFAWAQKESDALKDFTRSIKFDGITLNLVHLNDRTVEALFQAPTKYSMKVRAKQTTLLYVQGVAQKDIDFENGFVAEQGGETIHCTSHNIKNFENGKVSKGERIDGIIELGKKLDLSKPFKVKNGKGSVEFKFSEDVLKKIG